MKLAAWARSVGVHPQTAYAWVCEDRMPVRYRRLASGTILVGAAKPDGVQRVVLYARVSSHDQRADLDRQVSRLTEWASDAGWEVGQVVSEVGSGLNGKRPKLSRILSDPSASVIVVEHRDRLARFGVEHLHAVLAALGRRIVVIDDGETTDDLVRDMIEVLTSMCVRLYGRRGARNRAMRAVTATKRDPGGEAA
ncbi:IS607 family transposase [Mycobacterium ostraviense]|uniref:Resolvase, N terminal domain protein n=1 Tax=Mycobacterium kansasii TaxID=1768 RepID=A0A1V3X9P0_MYCKA|nr:IS607 family transposase [Mycobacterium ostraviense]OOK75954.1 resolvase, N terminal domain protein [Mycobacterium kansasii]UGT91575.1 IS607 family transposase [Mycobacterium ostraviense]